MLNPDYPPVPLYRPRLRVVPAPTVAAPRPPGVSLAAEITLAVTVALLVGVLFGAAAAVGYAAGSVVTLLAIRPWMVRRTGSG